MSIHTFCTRPPIDHLPFRYTRIIVKRWQRFFKAAIDERPCSFANYSDVSSLFCQKISVRPRCLSADRSGLPLSNSLLFSPFQRELTDDCVFNERLEDNYNYYTSTYHSTALKTFYVALNRHGGPRVTHLPAHKPLSKLSTYVKSFTLFVDERRSEPVISRLFGANHVKHGIKHLCDSGKELTKLNPERMFQPECAAAPKPAPDKKPTGPKGGGRRTPAALTTRSHQRPQNARPNACVPPEQCPRKKKKNVGRSVKGASSEEDESQSRSKPKTNKNAKKFNKNSRKQLEMTTSASGRSDALFHLASAKRWTPLDGTGPRNSGGAVDDDALNDMSGSTQIASNGHSAFADDDDEYNDEND